MRGPALSHDGPSTSIVHHYLGRAYLRLCGWETEGQLPPGNKAVLIAAPHTSGWDVPFMIAVAWTYRMRLNWLGKHTLFEGPLGGVIRRFGGVPVDRRSRHGAVQQVAKKIRDSDGMYMAISPAGTRSRGTGWKSGFYHIAVEAEVPIICAFLDFGRKVGGVGPVFKPSGDMRADMEQVRDFYSGMQGLKSGKFSEIKLAGESVRDGGGASEVLPRPNGIAADSAAAQ